MWKIRLHWFKNDPTPADGPCKSETEAREYAQSRSAQVQGKCEVIQGDKVVGTYVSGVLV